MSDDLIQRWRNERKYILEERDRTFSLMLTRAETAEAKLAKAVVALRECQEALRDHMKQYPHMAKGYTVDAEKNARTVLAELEGKE